MELTYCHNIKRQHPNSGVRLDFENLLKQFTETETVRYEQFSEIWRKMQFSMLCAGRQNNREVREFLEEVFHIALSYYMPPYNFQVRVGGLYLLYALYFTQTSYPYIKIRVSPQQWKQILEFQEDARSQQHLDVDFCYEKLVFQNAFSFVATAVSIYPRSKDTIENVTGSDISDELKESQGCLQTLFSPELLEQLSAVHTHYQKIKIGLAGPDAEQPARSLDMIQSKLVSNIVSRLETHEEKLTKLKQQVQQSKSVLDLSEEEDPTFEPSENKTAKLKAKAFCGLAKQTRSRRHRKIVLDTSPKTTSPKTPTKVTYKMPSDLSDEDEDEDDQLKKKIETVFLPMPSLTTEKEDFTKKGGKKKKKQLEGNQSSEISPGEKKKKGNKSAKKETMKKGGKKGISQESEAEKKIISPKKKRKDQTPNTSTDEIVLDKNKETVNEMVELGSDIGLPQIKNKPRSRKQKVLKKEKSKKVNKANMDVNKDDELEVSANTSLSSPKKKGRRFQDETLSDKDDDKNEELQEQDDADTSFSSPQKKERPREQHETVFNKDVDKQQEQSDADTSFSSPKKRGRTKKQQAVKELTDKNNKVETVSDTHVDKTNELQIGSDLEFLSPTRKRGRSKKESVGETEIGSDTDLPSAKKKQKRSLETKTSNESADNTTSQNTSSPKKKPKSHKKASQTLHKTNIPRQRPVAIQKKERPSKKGAKAKKDSLV